MSEESIISNQMTVSSVKSNANENVSEDMLGGASTNLSKTQQRLGHLNDKELVKLLNNMEKEYRAVTVENALFQSFLAEYDPVLLDDFEMELKKATDLPASGSKARTSSFQRSTRSGSLGGTSMISNVGQNRRVNLQYKIEMVLRALQEIQVSNEKFALQAKRETRNLRGELEELSLREEHVLESANMFEQHVVIQGTDPLTQRIPAEKFIKNLEDWLRSTAIMTEKLRFRAATLRVQNDKVSNLLSQRQELAENVTAVDFENVKIENRCFLQKLQTSTTSESQLKKIYGGANLVLAKHKKYLRRMQNTFEKLSVLIKEKEKNDEALEKDLNMFHDELMLAIVKYENCKKAVNMYKVPEVIDYVKLKKKLFDIKKAIKKWSRRINIQDISIRACILEMKNITGSDTVDSQWFESDESSCDVNSEALSKVFKEGNTPNTT